MNFAYLVQPGSFKPENHYYPQVVNATLCPQVAKFLQLGNKSIALRYCELHPGTNYERLYSLISTRPSVFQWSGSDIFKVIDRSGQNQIIVIETNSCPSGQKSMPPLNLNNGSGYHQLIRLTFVTAIENARKSNKLMENGGLAVVYDKNPMENRGYAAAMADVFDEPVYCVEIRKLDLDPPIKFTDEILYIRNSSSNWVPIRAAFRYVTETPWSRIPVQSKTLIINPIVACLAGGRNKMLADYAYEVFNRENESHGLTIRAAHTVRNVLKKNIPQVIKAMGGHAVVKMPYSNAGQGVFTIVNERELHSFMQIPQQYNRYIVQSLVGNKTWASHSSHNEKEYYQTGTVPNHHNERFVADLRMMVCASEVGFTPIAIYGRQAPCPLVDQLDDLCDSWSMLGTNLSCKTSNGEWATQSERLLVMDNNGWNQLGFTIDDLINAYIQTVFATTAIDRLAQQLLKPNGELNSKLFQKLDDDQLLVDEILL